MISISLCMIVKNEENVISRCLESVLHCVDEINIVDTGSTDLTTEVCRRFTDRIFEFQWIDHFSAARNYSFAQATQDFIFWLDADDVLASEDQRKLKDLKTKLTPDVDAVSMEYHLSFFFDGKPQQSLRRHRLVNRASSFRWIGAVHEYLDVSGNIYHSDVAVQHRKVSHDPRRNIDIFERMLARGEAMSPRDLYYYANELKDHGRYAEAVKFYERFMKTGAGWVEDVIRACNQMSDCYKQMNNEADELESALRALKYDFPRPETCCRISDVYFRRRDYEACIYWSDTAIVVDPVKTRPIRMFEDRAYSTWIPHLQLCSGYYELGNLSRAFYHNEQAAKYIPDDERIIHNRNFLEPLVRPDPDGVVAGERNKRISHNKNKKHNKRTAIRCKGPMIRPKGMRRQQAPHR